MVLEWEGLGETIDKGSGDLTDGIKGEKLVEEKEDNIYTEDSAFEGTVLESIQSTLTFYTANTDALC